MPMDNILYHWEMLQDSPTVYDDFKVAYPEFVQWMQWLPTYEIGEPPVGLFTFVCTPGGNAWIQGAMYDWRYEGRESVFLALARDLFERGEAHRVTSTVNEDRPAARAVMERMGFNLEGVLRDCGARGGGVEVWALIRSDVWQSQQE
jgi:RimJ/RimL family protein N-acetyltransferase